MTFFPQYLPRPISGMAHGCLAVFVFVAGNNSCWAQVPSEVAMYDTVILRSGGKIDGSAVEQEADNKRFYLVDLPDGTKIKLDSRAVSRIVPPPAAYGEYVKLLENLGDTVDSHWQMQKWCSDNTLYRQRDYHLNKAILLDPEFKEARSKLGYKMREGVWMLDEHFYSSQGFVKYSGGWRLPQGVNFVEQRDENRESLGQWRSQLQSMRSKFYKNSISEDEFLQIKDLEAVPVIIDMYDDKKTNSRFRRVVIEMIGGIPSNATHRKLISIYLNDPDITNSERALALLKQDFFDPIVTSRAMYPLMRPGQNTPNFQVRRAGFLIGELNDKAGVRNLIDGIITTHEVTNPNARSGNMNIARGNNGTQMQQGEGPKTLVVEVRNDEVLHALERLSGKSFGYSKEKWLNWYIDTQTLSSFDLRRDD